MNNIKPTRNEAVLRLINERKGEIKMNNIEKMTGNKYGLIGFTSFSKDGAVRLYAKWKHDDKLILYLKTDSYTEEYSVILSELDKVSKERGYHLINIEGIGI